MIPAQRKTGLLGGTFNPVHDGHLRLALFIRKRFNLDEIVFIPAWRPPHKQEEIASFAHRTAMLQLAIKDHPEFSLSLIEAARQGTSYTIDTLKGFTDICRDQHEWYFIIGADAFMDLPTWKEYRQLPRYAHFIIVSRPGVEKTMIGELINVSLPGYAWDNQRKVFNGPGGEGKIYLEELFHCQVSSTMIRQKRSLGESIDTLVPGEIAEYIQLHKLY